MGFYREVKGNLLDLFDEGEFSVIMHGANCMKTMGAGIAKDIKKRYPEAYYADIFCELPEGLWRLGKYSCTTGSDIFNLYTQERPGPCASLEAIALSLRLVADEAIFPDAEIGLPLIGCGLGGLEWLDVKPIIQRELKDFNVSVVHYDK